MHSFLFRLTLVSGLALAHSAFAQGVTGSALTGAVTREKGGAVAGASIELRNPGTGDAFHTTTNAAGLYFIDHVPPGGPYTVTATAEGFQPAVVADLILSLGQRLTRDIVLHAEFVEEIAVVAHSDVNADKGRTGASTTKKSAEILELPVSSRNIINLVATDPRVVLTGDGFSIAGQNSRFNMIQIDGGANNDLFGLAASGTPGGNTNSKIISLEAVQEFVVQVAPFDVRQGDFAGGLVNAITKSGTNTFHGGAFAYYQGKSLTGRRDDPTYNGFNSTQYGAFLGGPIIQDKAHFFISGDLQSRSASVGGNYFVLGDSTDAARVGFTAADAARFVDILKTKYGISNVGDTSAPNLGNPDQNLFVKVTSNQIPGSRLELSYNFVDASQDVLGRTPTGVSVPFFLNGGYQLSNSGFSYANITNTGRAKLTTNWDDSHLSNEFLGSASFVRDARSPQSLAPLIIVKAPGQVNGLDAFISAGAERFSQANALDQNIFQLQDNLTYAVDQHRLTFGTSNEFLGFRNTFLQAGIGAWEFDSLDALAAGTATAYNKRYSVSAAQTPGTARFSVNQPGFYVQDEYAVSENFSLTGGVRVDIPFLSTPITDTIVLNNSPLGIDTSKVPSGNPLWSPRVGFNWDARGNADTIVRGGLGIFSGRPPYVFVSNAYTINGLSQVSLTCGPGTFPPSPVPPFTPDPKLQPTDCKGGTGIPAPPSNLGEIDYFDPNTRYPQNLRAALGGDQRLPWWNLLATVDLLYTSDINEFYTNDENLTFSGYDGDGRPLYGNFSKSTPTKFSVSPNRVDKKTVVQAIKVFNKSGGNVTSATFQLQRPFARGLGISAAYTYARSFDRMSFTSSQALSNWRFAPVDGDLENRNLRPSAFDRPHKITITGTAALPFGFGVGLSYIGQSGRPYTWAVSGDINGDGATANDLPFIPANASQITLKDPTQYAALDAFIRSQQCLNDARGSMLQRGACRNPWNDYFDVQFTWTSPNWKGQRIAVQWDIFNVLNLINDSWGHYNEVTPFETANGAFLTAAGYDPVNKRPVYTFNPQTSISNTTYSPTLSRWRMQLGARYLF